MGTRLGGEQDPVELVQVRSDIDVDSSVGIGNGDEGTGWTLKKKKLIELDDRCGVSVEETMVSWVTL